MRRPEAMRVPSDAWPIGVVPPPGLPFHNSPAAIERVTLRHLPLAPHLGPEGDGEGSQPLHRLGLRVVGKERAPKMANARPLDHCLAEQVAVLRWDHQRSPDQLIDAGGAWGVGMAEKGELQRRRPRREHTKAMAAGVAGRIHQRGGAIGADAQLRGPGGVSTIPPPGWRRAKEGRTVLSSAGEVSPSEHIRGHW